MTPEATTSGDAAQQAAMPTGQAGLLASSARRSIVDALAALTDEAATEGLTAAELAERVELHPTTVRFHVDQLVAGGVLTAHFVRTGGVGRPSKKYALSVRSLGVVREQQRTQGDAAEPYEVLARLLAAALSSQEADSLTPEEAGVSWARTRAARRASNAPRTPETEQDPQGTVDHVVELLGEWGYTPETSTAADGAVEVTLTDCPFLDLAHTHPDVVCGVHRGLLRGALDAVGEGDAKVSLQPFVGPTTCRARLHLTGATPADPTPAHPTPADPDRTPTSDDAQES